MSIFTSKNGWKFLMKTQPTKSDHKKDKRIREYPLMPIRVRIMSQYDYFELGLFNSILHDF